MTRTQARLQAHVPDNAAGFDVAFPGQRPCTRCDGTQELVATAGGFGKYRCGSCQLVIGFDIQAEPVEFLLDRGQPSRYTKKMFGSHLFPHEQRLVERSTS